MKKIINKILMENYIENIFRILCFVLIMFALVGGWTIIFTKAIEYFLLDEKISLIIGTFIGIIITIVFFIDIFKKEIIEWTKK